MYGQVIDKETGEVIDQFPPEDLLKLAAKTRALLGTLADQKA